jgi:hypothetical protein
MFVICDKKSGYVRVTCTENPLNSVRLVSNWYENYDILEFPYMEYIRASETVLRVEQNQLKIIGDIESLRAQGLPHEYNNYAKLFEGE